MHAQMLMHVIAYGDVWTHVRESALKVDAGKKNPKLKFTVKASYNKNMTFYSIF